MKIIEIHIYGYGKLSDLRFSNLDDFQVFYGENEAGKSTIMAFIHSILFGFPTKQQSELSYEPKHASKYGGSLTVVFPDKGRAIIERVKGKASGNVSVLLEDGTRGGEELLKVLLQNINKNLFQSIFSFNLHGLQNVHQMNGDELGRFLFSAGALGTDRLLLAENALQKELEARFKPNGSKPYLNEKLKEIKQVYHDLKKAEQKNDEYWSMLQERELLERKLEELQLERSKELNKLSRMEEWGKVQSSFLKHKVLKEEASILEGIQFPVDGLARLDRLEDAIQPLNAQRSSLLFRIEELGGKLAQLQPQMELLDKEDEIHAAIESLPLLEKLKLEENELTMKLQTLDEEITLLGEKLHLPFEEERLLTTDTSVFMKERVSAVERKQRRLQEKKQILDERFEEERQTLLDIETRIESLNVELLSFDEREELRETIEFIQERKHFERELADIQERFSSLMRVKERKRAERFTKKGQERFQLILFFSLFTILLGFGLWSSNWLIAIIGMIGIAFSIITFSKKSPNKNDDYYIEEEITDLKKKKDAILKKINQSDIGNAAEIESLLEKDEDVQANLRHSELLLKQSNDQYEKIILAYEEWGAEAAQVESELIEMGNQLNLPQNVVSTYLMDAFLLIEKLKSISRERKHLKERQHAAAAKINEKIAVINELQSLFLVNKGTTIQESIFMIRKRLKEEIEKQIKHQELQIKIGELEEEYQQLVNKCQQYQKEIDQLLTLAQTISLEEYREKGMLSKKKAYLDDQLRTIEMNLKMSSLTAAEMERFSLMKDLSNVAIESKKRLTEIDEEIPKVQRKLAEDNYEIGLIEEGGTYTELLHKYKLMKDELESDAKEWAKFAAAKDLLLRTVERFKQEKLPKIISKAEEFLSFLTDGQYVRIYPKMETSGFLIKSSSGTLFEARELSQATSEQIYVSLRLALAETVYEKYSLPIIIDDSFVNFDHKRTEKMVNLLKGLSGTQILFFTCHQYLLSHFLEQQIIDVTNKEAHLSR
ncbi:ATP-binding protein [Cytobacillus massiliigabonensis]|uniref:ATP-binding protein n=1 Tax=Cytobacillus massiliigabonensis TaxID=1871011 RepID=UPI000C84CCCC|nr:AAA family ATPase [Cytobacillus massiliigabonensis]